MMTKITSDYRKNDNFQESVSLQWNLVDARGRCASTYDRS